MKHALLVLLGVALAHAAQTGGALVIAEAAEGREADGVQRALVDSMLFEGPDRDRWQRPDYIMDALGIADGAVVADIGTGRGWFAVRLARRVGPQGRVVAEDIRADLLDAVARRAAREGWTNIDTVLGTPDDPKLAAGAFDAVLIVDTYHQVENGRVLLANVAAALKPSGRLGIVDYRTDGGGPGPPNHERIAADEVVRDAESVGLRLLTRDGSLPFQYLLIFGPALDATGPAPALR